MTIANQYIINWLVTRLNLLPTILNTQKLNHHGVLLRFTSKTPPIIVFIQWESWGSAEHRMQNPAEAITYLGLSSV